MADEQNIIRSWQQNAGNWISLIARDGIASRKLATNDAILNTVTALHPASVLDLGCGEGWLSSAMAAQDIRVTGTDAVPELVDHAARHIAGTFHTTTYEDISSGRFRFEQTFDVIVSNFALLGKDSVDDLLPCLPALLNPGGSLIIQTLHPGVRKEAGDYVSGWKKGSWDGLGEAFTDPYDWYYRTMEDWEQLLVKSGFLQVVTEDIRHPQEGNLLSVIFRCSIK